MYTHKEAIEAMRARIAGVWDNEQLMKLGPLANSNDDIRAILRQTEEDTESAPQKLHVLSVYHNQGQVEITSDYWDQTIIPYDNEPGSKITPELDTAKKYLESKGFEIIGTSTGKGHRHYIVAKNFVKLK